MRIIMRPPGAAYANAISTHPCHARLDVTAALHQHEALRALMVQAGADVVLLPPDPVDPDAPFVQDVMISFPPPDDPAGRSVLLVATRPGAPARRPEVAAVVAAARALVPAACRLLEIQAQERSTAATSCCTGIALSSASRAARTSTAPSSWPRRSGRSAIASTSVP